MVIFFRNNNNLVLFFNQLLTDFINMFLDSADMRIKQPGEKKNFHYWWAYQDSNLGPVACETTALTN